jgi:hypothetical protein
MCSTVHGSATDYDHRVPLPQDLAEWEDWDGAAYLLGRALGLFENQSYLEVKGVFWTDNHLGNGLHDALLSLVRAGVLERRDEPDEQFRWQPPVGGVCE